METIKTILFTILGLAVLLIVGIIVLVISIGEIIFSLPNIGTIIGGLVILWIVCSIIKRLFK